MYIYPLFRIHHTSLVSAYFRLDSRKCKCLEYLFIIFITGSIYLLGWRNIWQSTPVRGISGVSTAARATPDSEDWKSTCSPTVRRRNTSVCCAMRLLPKVWIWKTIWRSSIRAWIVRTVIKSHFWSINPFGKIIFRQISLPKNVGFVPNTL
jgi:hypothetical protein